MEPDDYSQQHPDYDGTNSSTGCRRRGGKITREGQRKKMARYRSTHRATYNAYMRRYMAARRAAAR